MISEAIFAWGGSASLPVGLRLCLWHTSSSFTNPSAFSSILWVSLECI